MILLRHGYCSVCGGLTLSRSPGRGTQVRCFPQPLPGRGRTYLRIAGIARSRKSGSRARSPLRVSLAEDEQGSEYDDGNGKESDARNGPRHTTRAYVRK